MRASGASAPAQTLKKGQKMEKVERKKREGKGPRRLLWLFGALILTALCVFAAIRLNKDSKPEMPEIRPETRGTVVDRDTSEILRLTVQARDQEKWTVARGEDGTLRLEGEEDWIPDETLTAKLEDAMANVVYEEVLTENAADYQSRLSDFGLAEPVMIASAWYTDGSSVTLRFGNASGLEDRDFRYMTVDGDPRLFAVASSLLEDLRIGKELLHPVEQPEIQGQRLDRITVLNGDGSKRIEWMLEGEITDSNAAEEWMLTWPFRYPADYDTMVSLRTNAANLRMGLYIGKAEELDLAALGLDPAERILEVHLAAGTTGRITEEGVYQTTDRGAETLRFEIGTNKNEMTVYVRCGDTVYTMNRFTLETLTEAEPLSSAARYPVTTSLSALAELEVEKNGSPDVYVLTRETKAGEDEGEEDVTELHCSRNGTEISAEAFEAAYERMLVVTVSGRLPDGWEKKETTERYVFRTTNGKTHTVELSPFDAMHDAVTLDGCTVFYLIRDGMPPLP